MADIDQGMDLEKFTTGELQAALEAISVPSTSPRAIFRNWAKTFACRPQRVFEPTTALQCRQIVELARREGAILHPVGVGHSPSDLACTNGWLIRMGGLSGLQNVDHQSRTATFLSGTVLHEVHRALLAANPPLAIPNIGSISDQTIGGLISTASHGSGLTFPVLSSHVKSLVLILPLPGAPVVHVSPTEDAPLYNASLCGLGATGVILEVEIEVEDAFRLEERKVPMEVGEAIKRIGEIKGSAEHVRMWWYPDGDGMVVARANRTYQPAKPSPSFIDYLLGYQLTQFFLLLCRYFRSLTPWVGKWAWYLAKGESVVVDDGFKVLNFDCLFPQYALEWAIDSSEAQSTLRDLQAWLEREARDPKGLRVHFPIEIRWSCRDDIWLSPSYGRETTWIGVVTYRPYGLPVPYRAFHARFAEILESHGGRPHWAKQHSMTPKDLESMYPKFGDFREVLARVDPQGVLRSEYVRRHIEGEDVGARTFKER